MRAIRSLALGQVEGDYVTVTVFDASTVRVSVIVVGTTWLYELQGRQGSSARSLVVSAEGHGPAKRADAPKTFELPHGGSDVCAFWVGGSVSGEQTRQQDEVGEQWSQHGGRQQSESVRVSGIGSPQVAFAKTLPARVEEPRSRKKR